MIHVSTLFYPNRSTQFRLFDPSKDSRVSLSSCFFLFVLHSSARFLRVFFFFFPYVRVFERLPYQHTCIENRFVVCLGSYGLGDAMSSNQIYILLSNSPAHLITVIPYFTSIFCMVCSFSELSFLLRPQWISHKSTQAVDIPIPNNMVTKYEFSFMKDDK